MNIENTGNTATQEWVEPAEQAADPGTKIIAKRGREYMVLRFEDIAYFFIENGISYLVDRKTRNKYIAAKPLRRIEDALNPRDFFRANKKYLINSKSVVKFRPGMKGKLELTLDPEPNERIVISQLKARAFKEWILLP
ncbi:MAG TPA: LytTR family DNA-binding domain-containing protein [Puia sp.]|nr:LytTR family DNA-binding domain-containing protein [Puia sp.]